MDIQPPKSPEPNVGERTKKKPLSTKLAMAVFVIAILGVVVFLLYYFKREIFHHTTPPIIIKSFDTDNEPVQVETEYILSDATSLSAKVDSSPLDVKKYKLKGFGKIKYVSVSLKGVEPDITFKNESGSVVEMWLQRWNGTGWEDVAGGPHLIASGTSENGTSWDFTLSSDELSGTKPNPSLSRPFKRTFKKKWRIWKVRVDNNTPIEMGTSPRMDISFDNHSR